MVPKVDSHHPVPNCVCNGAQATVIPGGFAHCTRSGVLRERVGHLEQTAKNMHETQGVQYIVLLMAKAALQSESVTLPRLALDTSEQTHGGALGLC